MSAWARDRLLPPLLLVALGAGAYLAWLMRVELIVIFASALFGVSLSALAQWLSMKTGLPHRASVVVWYLAGFALGIGFLFFAGQRLTGSYGELGERLPAAISTLESRLEGKPVLSTVGRELADIREGMTANGSGESDLSDDAQEESDARQMHLVRVSVRTLSLVVVWAVLSFFIAFDGQGYVRTTVRLFPPGRRHVGEDLITSLCNALPWWLVGRVSSMALVALLTGPALFFLGIPLPWLLGIIAGLFSFVPFLGPLASVAPAALVTLDAAPDKLLWVFGLYGLIQFIESNFITPRIQQHVAAVPPMLLIGGQLLMGVLVGLVGIMFSTPLILAMIVTVQVVYLRHALGEDVKTPHE